MMGQGDLPGGQFLSFARGVSADGSIVVGRSDTGRGPQWWLQEAFIWDAAHGMRNLREVLVTEHGADLTGWLLLEGSGVSDDGRTIVGFAQNPAGQLEAYVARIPEPATFVMFLVLGLVGTRWR